MYRGRPVTPGSSEVGANAGSEVGRQRWLGVFLQGWNNGAPYQRQKEIETDTGRGREAGVVVKASWPVSVRVYPGGRPGQGASEKRILQILSLSFNNEGS